MTPEIQLTCVVQGSFRFKRKIDEAIEELTELGVQVLGPEKGDLYRSEWLGFYHLKWERPFTPREVEDSFLSLIRRSDFTYLVNPDGYVGNIVSFELGHCMGWGIPVYASNPIDHRLDPDPLWEKRIDYVEVMSVSQTVEKEQERKSKETEILVPTFRETLIFTSPVFKERRSF